MRDTSIGVAFPGAHRRGGVERVAWDLMSFLSNRHAVSFIGRDVPDGLPADVRHLRVPDARGIPSALRPLAFRRHTAALVRRRPVSTLVTFGAECPPGDVLWVHSVLAAWIRSSPGITVSGLRVPGRARFALPKNQVLLGLERHYFRTARPRLILCTSTREVADLERLYRVDPSLTAVVPNGYDPGRFNLGRRFAERDEVRGRIGARPDEIVLLLVANELHRKGFVQTVEAMARSGDERLRLDVVGRADPRPFAEMTSRLGVSSRVRHHGPSPDVGQYMAAADLLVLPTQYEPFGLVIIEALATGLPVITSRIAGAAEAVHEGETGLLLDDPLDVEELGERIRCAASSDLPRWSSAAAASVDHYRVDRVMPRVERLIVEGLAR